MNNNSMNVQLEALRQNSLCVSVCFLFICVLGGSLGASSARVPTSSPSQSRNSSGGDGSALENGLGPRRGAWVTGSENWQMAYSDSGNAYYKE